MYHPFLSFNDRTEVWRAIAGIDEEQYDEEAETISCGLVFDMAARCHHQCRSAIPARGDLLRGWFLRAIQHLCPGGRISNFCGRAVMRKSPLDAKPKRCQPNCAARSKKRRDSA